MQCLRFILWALLLVAVAACTNPSSPNAAQTTSNAETKSILATTQPKKQPNEPPQAQRNTENFDEKLANNFTQEQITFLKKIDQDFNSLRTASQMSDFYHNKLPKLLELLNKKINQYDPEAALPANEIDDKWAWFTAYMPYVKIALFCSECTTESYVLLQALRDKAEITEGKEDDTFFDALLIANKTEEVAKEQVCDKMPNSWIKLVNCDLCGADILGSSKHLNTLQALVKAKNVGSLFAQDLQNTWEEALPMTATNYYLDKETVLKELELIINTVELSKKEKESLKNLRYTINIGKNIQFDCQKGNCQFLAM
jgi:hypothetical protein